MFFVITGLSTELSSETAEVRENPPVVVLVGNPATTMRDSLIPLNFNYRNSLSENLYFADELSIPSGQIFAIAFKNNFPQALSNQAVKLYMANTGVTGLSGGWLPGDGYNLVFDGMVSFPSGINEVLITLQTPFAYSGGNLALRVFRPYDTQSYGNTNHFYQTATTAYPNRTRHAAADMTNYDPLAPQPTGTLTNRVPNTWFWFQGESSGVSGLTIQRLELSLSLSWDVYPGASAYNIYASDSPQMADWELLGQSSINAFLQVIEPGQCRFYRVTAILD